MSKILKTTISCDCGGLLNYRTVGDMSGGVGFPIVTTVWCGRCGERKKCDIVKNYKEQLELEL